MLHRFYKWYGYRMVWGERGDRGLKVYGAFILTTLLIAITSLLVFTNMPWYAAIVIPCITFSMLNIIIAGLNLVCIGHWDEEAPDA